MILWSKKIKINKKGLKEKRQTKDKDKYKQLRFSHGHIEHNHKEEQ